MGMSGQGEKVLRGELCPPTSARGLYWNWTQVGDLSAQPCPGGATGLALWRCVGGSAPAAAPHRHPAAPDLSECRSVWLTNLNSRITEGDTIISIANDLCSVSILNCGLTNLYLIVIINHNHNICIYEIHNVYS